MSPKYVQMRHKGRGVSLPYTRLQTIFFTTENPLDFSGEKANTTKQVRLKEKNAKRGQKRPKRGISTPNAKTPLMIVLMHENIRPFLVIHKAQINMQDRSKANARLGIIK